MVNKFTKIFCVCGLACFILMSIGYIFNGKSIPGSCGNSSENPCECSFAEKLKCKLSK